MSMRYDVPRLPRTGAKVSSCACGPASAATRAFSLTGPVMEDRNEGFQPVCGGAAGLDRVKIFAPSIAR